MEMDAHKFVFGPSKIRGCFRKLDVQKELDDRAGLLIKYNIVYIKYTIKLYKNRFTNSV